MIKDPLYLVKVSGTSTVFFDSSLGGMGVGGVVAARKTPFPEMNLVTNKPFQVVESYGERSAQ